MRRVPFVNFGQGNPSDFRQVQLNGPIYGVRIASDSEIDQCRLFVDGATPEPWPSGLAAITALSTRVLSEVGGGWASAHKVSVARPLHGAFNITGGRKDMIVAPTRATFTAAQAAIYGYRGPTLILEILDHPSEAMFSPAKRAPLDIAATYFLSAAESAHDVIVPFFGRNYWSVEAVRHSVVAAGTLTIAGSALRNEWDDTTIRTIGWDLWAATAPDASYAAIVKEGEGEFDYIKLSLAYVSGTSCEVTIHIRAED